MIRFNAVTKRFGDGTIALDDVSFVIKPGEFVFVTGHSGSGKTTIMKLLTREYSPSEGDIHFKENLLNELSSRELAQHRREIGVVFQDYKLIPDYTVWENIALPLYITGTKESDIETRVSDLLKLVNLTDKAYQFPSQLSGGEAQRVSIARALANAPSVIFADEPTGNLDLEATMLIAQLLRKINELGTTILCATHDLSVLEHLKHHRRIYLEKGKVKEDTHADKHAEAKHEHKNETEVEEEGKDDYLGDHEGEGKEKVEKTEKKSGPRIKFSLPKMPWSKDSKKKMTKKETSADNDKNNDEDEPEEEDQNDNKLEVKVEDL